MSKMIHQELIQRPSRQMHENQMVWGIIYMPYRPCVNTGKPVELVGV